MRIGVDLGGTKIAATALDDAGRSVAARRTPTPAGDYRATVDAVAAVVEDLEDELGVRCPVGVGTPGSPEPRSRLQRNANSTALNGKPLEADLCSRLGRTVRIANDANCFALSEAVDGAASGAAVVFGAILGTGVGGGLVVHGRLIEGHLGIAGEWGHNPLPWPSLDDLPGPPCYCGKRGCIETFLSGPGLARAFERRTGATAGATEVAERASGGEAEARATLAEYKERLARGLAHVVNLLDPTIIVLGGGLSQIASLYDGLTRLMARYAFCAEFEARVVPPLHGDASGVRGAAWLWPPGSPPDAR